MRKNTILGRPPSGNRPGPDGMVPGDGPAEDAVAEHETGADADGGADETSDRDGSGDPETAFHRSRLYALLALGFERPDDTVRAAIEERSFDEALLASSRGVDEAVATTARTVATHLDGVDDLHDAWASLFGLEEGVTVSPYELTYMPGPLTTNVRKLADLAGFYEAFELEVVPGKNDRRDHVCFLLEFLGSLSRREAALQLDDDDEGVAIVRDAYRQFLEDHLGRWYWRFAEEVSRHGDGFYPALADVLAALLEHEIDRLDLDPRWVPDDPTAAAWTEDVFGDAGRGCESCGIDPGGGGAGPTPRPWPGPHGPGPDREPDRADERTRPSPDPNTRGVTDDDH